MLAPRGLGTLVEDVVQETFLRAFRALGEFEFGGPAKLSTWLLTIASRLAINEIKRRRPASTDLDAQELAAQLPSRQLADSDLHRHRLRIALCQAIGELTVEQQATFVLHQFHGLDDKTVAGALKVEVGAVKSRLHRARTQLRKALREVIDEHPSAV